MLEFSNKFVSATKEYSTQWDHVNAPVFRRSFTLESAPDKAEILICGLGFYDLFVNGEKITKGYLAPYISNPDDITYYDRYDLTAKLHKGENVIGAVLGNGMNAPTQKVWDFVDAVYSSAPRMALSFRAECGENVTEFDATGFKCAKSPITYDNLREGVRYDARLEAEGWCEAGFDDSSWGEVLLSEKPRGYARLCEAEPIAVIEELSPVSVRVGALADYSIVPGHKQYYSTVPDDGLPREGGYIYDFGKNTAGVFRFKIKGAKAGQVISFQCGEYLDKDGKLSYKNVNFYPDGYSQRDVYICKGEGEEIFVPMFTYHGCRYIYVYGLTEAQATPDAMTFLVMCSDIKKRAGFKCSNETANKLWEAVLNSDLSNLYYFPTDCPHREKNGWTGDAATSAEHMIMTLSVENSWREWLHNIRAAQNEEGTIPGIVPTAGWGFKWGNGPAWDRVLFDLPYMSYIYRGEVDVIKENRHAMMRYLEYAANKRDADGLVLYGLGDWSPVGTANCTAFFADNRLTDSIMVYDMCRKAEKMFCAIGYDLGALFARTLGDEMRCAIREHLIDFSDMTTVCNSQTGVAMCIYYDIFEEAEKITAAKRLCELIHMADGNFECGYLGIRVILHVLAEFGESELAYKLIMKDEFPSFAYYINKGFTTLPESFVPEIERCQSLNHHFFGDTNHWFMRHVVGVNVNPDGNDPNRIVVKPNFVGDLTFAEGEYEAPKGKISVKWVREGEKIRLSVKNDSALKVEMRLPHGYMFGFDNHYRSFYKGGNRELVVYPKRSHY